MPKVSVTLTFHLFFKHWSHYPPIWRSPSDYQSFIYFRAVSHKKKSILKCHLSPFSAAPFIGASLLGDAGDTSFQFFCGGVCHPCHPSALRKNWKKGTILLRLELKTVEMFGIFKLNSYFCNGIKYRLMVHVNENICIRLLSKNSSLLQRHNNYTK